MQQVHWFVATWIYVPMALLKGLGELDHDGFEAQPFRDHGELALADGRQVLGGDGEGDAGGVGEELEGGDGRAAQNLDFDGLQEARISVRDVRLPLDAGAEVLGVGGRGDQKYERYDQQMAHTPLLSVTAPLDAGGGQEVRVRKFVGRGESSR